jgi:hypothetical protein
VSLAFKAVASAGSLSGTTVQIAKPAGLVHGDVVIAAVMTAGYAAPLPSIGSAGMENWYDYGSTSWNLDGASNDGYAGMWHHVVDASDDVLSYWTFAHEGVSCNDVGVALVYSGALPTVPTIVSAIGGTNSTSAVAASITTDVADCQVITIIWSSKSATAPGGMTEREDIGYSLSHISCNDVAQAAAGASGTKTSTLSSSQYQWVYCTLFLRPAGGGLKHSLFMSY